MRSRDHIMFDSGIKRIWKTEEKAKVQDCVHYFVNECNELLDPINHCVLATSNPQTTIGYVEI